MAQRMNRNIIYIIKKQKCGYKSNFYNKYLLLMNLRLSFPTRLTLPNIL